MSEMMAETAAPPAEDAPEIVSAFPLPPAFFVLYRDGADAGPPPPAPMEPQYHMFGTPFSTQDVVPDLLPMPGQKLYLSESAVSAATSAAKDAADAGADGEGGGAAGADADKSPADDGSTAAATPTAKAEGGAGEAAAGDVDFKRQMKKINRSLLANFMELVDVLIKQPALFNEKLADLELLFLNMHNLINAFRPHQARETILHMLQMQIQERRDAAHDIHKTIDEARRTVEDVHGELHDHAVDDARSQDAADIKMEDADHQGDALEANTSPVSTGGTTAAAAGAATGPAGDLSARAREVQQIQESFFSALQSVAGVTQ